MNYTDKISLIENERGVFSLDTTMGCRAGVAENPRGCYGDCYAANAARRYGRDFGQMVVRRFVNEAHKELIRRQIDRMSMPFVRIGSSGDPSENWAHTLAIIEDISIRRQLALFSQQKEIVIITKHWTLLTDAQLETVKRFKICINTSVSALDPEDRMMANVDEFLRLKPYCRSVLRIVSCDFNLENAEGHRMYKIQVELFKHSPTLDTVFRPSKNNPLVTDGIIKVKMGRFLGAKMLLSKYNRKTYVGKCSTCKEMCGVNL